MTNQQNYLACVLCTSLWRAVISVSFFLFLSAVSELTQSWPASSSNCSPVSMSAVPPILLMMAKIILTCSFSNWWWIHRTCVILGLPHWVFVWLVSTLFGLYYLTCLLTHTHSLVPPHTLHIFFAYLYCNGGSNSSARIQLLPVMGYFSLTAIFYLIWHYEHLLDFMNIYEYLFRIMTFSHVTDHVLSVATHVRHML